MADCKWMKDEFCVNADCPMCADYCPVVNYPGVCQFEDRGEDVPDTHPYCHECGIKMIEYNMEGDDGNSSKD